jgi:hypothetical protein
MADVKKEKNATPGETPDDPRIPAGIIEKLRAEHGSVVVVGNKHAIAAFKAASAADWQRFSSDMMNEKEKANAQRRLVLNCRVWPSTEEFAAILEKHPAFTVVCSGPVVDFSGAEEITVKKEY